MRHWRHVDCSVSVGSCAERHAIVFGTGDGDAHIRRIYMCTRARVLQRGRKAEARDISRKPWLPCYKENVALVPHIQGEAPDR